ncbi:MAG: hypothetical protein ACTHOO_01135 [Alcanivorax sp.]
MNFADLLISPAGFVPLIVGCVFFSLGLNFVAHFYRFRARSNHVNGTVKAIEKYVSKRQGAGHGTAAQLFYRPLVEFIYKDEIHKTFGPSVSHLRHKLGQNVTVMINEPKEGGPIQAKLDDSVNVLMGSLFAIIGAGALLIYILVLGGSGTVTLIMAATAWGVGHIISSGMLSGKQTLIESPIETKPKPDSTLIETKSDYMAEVSSHSFWGSLIGMAGLLGGMWIMNNAYGRISDETRQYIHSDFSGFWNEFTAGDLSTIDERALILFGIGLFFLLTSLWSLYFVRRQHGSISM